MTDNIKVPVSGVIRFDQTACTGCGTCELVCSSIHGGIINPKLSCITIYIDPAQCEPDHDVCRQCRYPSCLYACPSDAILVDDATGARYIEYENCTACGSCYKACPFTPDRAMIKSRVENGEENYFKCDLCRGRDEGPMCVRFCPARALVFVTATSRKKSRVQEDDAGREEVATTIAKDFFKPESQQE
ncbi:MAG: 4Fe-4S dicluster domain-containing protein [Nitrospina sp.]|jgi:anaerobic carbon-monoxide dehydrogenase iron sulfur subunit|nr:4Fe-4S dicluster domain-containing protein [Nitrospina sp.]